ncbi:MAG TPA: hypothetical protein VF168_12945 [Trueperaceae bacterium]
MGIKLPNQLKRLSVFTFVVLISMLPQATAQQADAVIDYMLQNRVGFSQATGALGLSMFEVAEELGYDEFSGLFDALVETSLLHVECWSAVAYLQGTAEEIGLSSEELTQRFRLRMSNDISFVPECDDLANTSYLALSLNVWTVGEDYPVAYHVAIEGSIFPVYDGRPENSFENAWLGYAATERVKGEVREAVEESVYDLALDFLKVRDFR